MRIFYAPDIVGEQYVFNKEESKHIAKVLRLSVGDVIQLVDGKGTFFKAEIISEEEKKCSVQVLEKEEYFGKRNFDIHIAIAPTKNIARFEWFLEKSTEIGIDSITPLICKNAERKVIKAERLNKIIEAAMKQSIKAYHPKLHPLTSFNDFINQQHKGQLFIAHCENTNKCELKNEIKRNEHITILIGPEGDFTSKEIIDATNKGFTPISLGNSRLRTETAGIVACNTVHLVNQ